MSSTSCESLRSLSCKTIISFAINLSQSCSIPSLLITFSQKLEIVTAQLHCICRFFHLYFNLLNSVCSEYIETVHLNITLRAQIDDRVWKIAKYNTTSNMVHAPETIIWGTVDHVIWVCNKWYMEQLEGWDIYSPSSFLLAYKNIRFSSLFAARDVSRRGTSATQRQKFHTDDIKSVRNPVRSADWSTE